MIKQNNLSGAKITGMYSRSLQSIRVTIIIYSLIRMCTSLKYVTMRKSNLFGWLIQ